MDTSSSQEKCPNYCDCHPGTGRSRACRGGDDTRKRCSIRRKNNQIKGKFLGEIGHQAPGCCSVTKSCLTLCNPMNCSTPDLPVPHDLPEFAQIHVHWVGDAIQPSLLLLPPSPVPFSLSQHQGLFQRVSSSHQMATKYWSFSFSISPSIE